MNAAGMSTKMYQDGLGAGRERKQPHSGWGLGGNRIGHQNKTQLLCQNKTQPQMPNKHISLSLTTHNSQLAHSSVLLLLTGMCLDFWVKGNVSGSSSWHVWLCSSGCPSLFGLASGNLRETWRSGRFSFSRRRTQPAGDGGARPHMSMGRTEHAKTLWEHICPQKPKTSDVLRPLLSSWWHQDSTISWALQQVLDIIQVFLEERHPTGVGRNNMVPKSPTDGTLHLSLVCSLVSSFLGSRGQITSLWSVSAA